MMAKTISIFSLFILLVLTGCGKSNPTATVGDYITVNAEIPEESQDLDFIWELTNIPGDSELGNSQLTSGELNASVMFIPDVAGTYSIEVSVFQYNDEISTQSFSFDVIGKELSDKNISVNCVTPAAAKTKIFDQISQEHIDYMLSKIPRGRFLKVDELASMVSWLVSEENSYTTSAVFDLSGGRATY